MNLGDWLLEQVEPEPNSGCWLWVGGGITEKGYARPMPSGRREYAHRLAYIAFVGSIPDGLEIDHRCRVRCCVNPQHLEVVPHIVNMRRQPRCGVFVPTRRGAERKSEWRRRESKARPNAY